jgi:hypothetical protein
MVGAWCLMPQVNNVVFAMIAATTVETNVAHPTIQQHTREFLDTFSTPRPASYTPSAVRSSIYNGNDCWHESSCYTADKTRILLTHVPLYRPPNTDCGDLRLRSRALRDGKGFSYVSQPNPHTHTHNQATRLTMHVCICDRFRNMLPEPISTELLHIVKPHFVFSGDDHDQCRVLHAGDIPEVMTAICI